MVLREQGVVVAELVELDMVDLARLAMMVTWWSHVRLCLMKTPRYHTTEDHFTTVRPFVRSCRAILLETGP